MKNIDLKEILKNDIIDIWYNNICLLDYREEIRKIVPERRFDFLTNEIITTNEAVDRYGNNYSIITEPL